MSGAWGTYPAELASALSCHCVTSRHENGEVGSFFKQNGIRCVILFKNIYVYFWQWLELCLRERTLEGEELQRRLFQWLKKPQRSVR